MPLNAKETNLEIQGYCISQIEYYLKYDYPEPKTASYLGGIARFYSEGNAEKRRVAKSFKSLMEKTLEPDQALREIGLALFKKNGMYYINDKKLRLRLLEALANYYKVVDDVTKVLNAKLKELDRSFKAAFLAYRGIATIVGANEMKRLTSEREENLRIQVLTNIIQPKLVQSWPQLESIVAAPTQKFGHR